MKKNMIIIVSIVYALSIILVAFLGFVAEVYFTRIYTEEINLIFDPNIYYKVNDDYYEFISEGSVIYSVTRNQNYDPSYEDPKPGEGDVDKSQKYKYIYKFENKLFYDYYYENFNQGTIKITAEAYSSEGEVSDPSLNFSIPSNLTSWVNLSEDGTISFLNNYQYGQVTVTIISLDGGSKNTETRISIEWSY